MVDQVRVIAEQLKEVTESILAICNLGQSKLFALPVSPYYSFIDCRKGFVVPLPLVIDGNLKWRRGADSNIVIPRRRAKLLRKVEHVLRAINNPKVGHPVVPFVPIDMVYKLLGPLPCMKKPLNAVLKVMNCNSINAKAYCGVPLSCGARSRVGVGVSGVEAPYRNPAPSYRCLSLFRLNRGESARQCQAQRAEP